MGEWICRQEIGRRGKERHRRALGRSGWPISGHQPTAGLFLSGAQWVAPAGPGGGLASLHLSPAGLLVPLGQCAPVVACRMQSNTQRVLIPPSLHTRPSPRPPAILLLPAKLSAAAQISIYYLPLISAIPFRTHFEVDSDQGSAF